MARGVNKVILVGNLGADPELRTMPSGGQVANLRMATTESWKDRQSGDMQERTEWHRVVFYGRLAEVCGEYLRKGSQIYVEGSLRTRKWQDKQGADHYTTEINGREMQMLGSPRSGGGGGDDRPPPREHGRDYEDSGDRRGTSKPDDGDFDDDIPFSWAVALPLLGLLMWAAHHAQTMLQV